MSLADPALVNSVSNAESFFSLETLHCGANNCTVFTALHVMQTRYSEENSVRPSVRLSVTRVIPDKMEERSGPDFHTIRKNIYPNFLRRRIVGGGRPLLREILGQPTTVGTKLPIFNQ